jgi:hypothetical protein
MSVVDMSVVDMSVVDMSVVAAVLRYHPNIG